MEHKERHDHDRWFKQLIPTFFEEFILAFFPDIYEYLDYQHITFLNQEVYTDIIKGRKGEVDILAETKLKGENTLIIVHIEPQSTYSEDFNDRMFFYFSRLYEKYRCPILPIAVYSYDQMKPEVNSFQIQLPFKEVLSFNFFTVHLKSKNWREYIKHPNPVALALLGKMGYDQNEKVKIKFEFLRMLLRLELDPARQTLVAGIFEKYLRLSPIEEQELIEQLKQIPNDEVNHIMELMTSWEEKGMEKGKKVGKEEGKAAGKFEAKLDFAKLMLNKGYPYKEIHELTGLTEAEIEKLKDQMD